MKKLGAILSFLKIGAIGFGGGTALIPVIEREAIEKNPIITKDNFREELVLQGITPGALPLKVACGVGVGHSGIFAVTLSYSVAFVGLFLAILLTTLLSIANDAVLKQTTYIAVGISAFIIVVVSKFILKVPKDSKKDKFFVRGLALLFFALIFSVGAKLESFIELFTNSDISIPFPVLSITSILVLGVNFVLFTKFEFEKNLICYTRYILAISVTILGILCFSNKPIINNKILNIVLYVVIALMITSAIVEDIIKAKKASTEKKKVSIKNPLLAIAILFIPFIVLLVICILLNKMEINKFFAFTLNSILSVVTTFGGGTAYISVAEGVFIDSGLVSSDLFWSQIVPISNALPGPLLVKMLASIWYYQVFNVGGVGYAIVYALYGGILGITITVVTYMLIYILFQYLKNLSIFDKLKISILPMIAGLLIPTVLSMVVNMMQTTIGIGLPNYLSLIMALVLVGIGAFTSKIKMYEPLAILSLGGISFGVINLLISFA